VADDLFGVLETCTAVISDRFSPRAERGATGASRRLHEFVDTDAFRIGDVDITSADGGIPLLVPPLLFWERIGVTTGAYPRIRVLQGC